MYITTVIYTCTHVCRAQVSRDIHIHTYVRVLRDIQIYQHHCHDTHSKKKIVIYIPIVMYVYTHVCRAKVSHDIYMYIHMLAVLECRDIYICTHMFAMLECHMNHAYTSPPWYTYTHMFTVLDYCTTCIYISTPSWWHIHTQIFVIYITTVIYTYTHVCPTMVLHYISPYTYVCRL